TAVYQCIRQNKSTIQEGYGFLACEIKRNATVRLQTRLMECPGNPGRTWIGTYGQMDVETTVQTALRTKVPKLTKTAADLRLLILERDQIHLVPKYIVRAIDGYRAQFPQLQSVDEIWIAETHEDRRVVLFDRLRPDYSYVPCFIFDGDKVLRQAYD
ncbi:hypothetical protein, partial [Accumulibacter sp.]|uniref:hypothetical protein n=1 Tax=Accumulibacter sp. TaxID=2053492 RepID=UPI001AD27F9B